MSDPIDETEADVADVLEQSESFATEPVEDVVRERERVDAADSELTGEEAEDSGQV